MPAQYPSAIVTTTQLPNNRSDSTATATNHIADHNNASFEIIAVETELGVNPSGSYITVKARLDAFEALLTGNLKLPSQTITANYTASDTLDFTLLVDTTSGPITITLPTPPILNTRFEIKDKLGTSESNPITIVTAGSELIDTSASATIASSFEALTLVFDGINWFII